MISMGLSLGSVWSVAGGLGLQPNDLWGQLIDRSPVPIAVASGPRLLLEYLNDAFCALADILPNEALGRPLREVLPDLARPIDTSARRALESGRSVVLGHEALRTARGTVRTVRCSLWPLVDPSGASRGLGVVVEDVTPDAASLDAPSNLTAAMREANAQLVLASLRERDHAESAERERSRLRALLETVPDAIVVADAAGRLAFINGAGREILGIGTPEAHGEEALAALQYRHLDGTPLPREREPLERAIQGERFEGHELLLATPSGGVRRVLFHGTQSYDGAGRLTLAMIVFRDVTRLRELEKLREEYASLVSHDLRGPLGNVLLYTELVKQSLCERGIFEEVDKLERIERNIAHMNSMIEELLDAARLGSASEVRERAWCDLTHLIRNVVDRMDERSRCRVEFEGVAGAQVILAEPAEIERAIGNLLSNALKYSPAHSVVRVRLKRRRNAAVLDVVDRGVGIPAKDLEFVFDRFYRARSTRNVPGTGLGLYIARLIVEAHGGRIRARSSVGAGSTFTMILPAAPVQAH